MKTTIEQSAMGTVLTGGVEINVAQTGDHWKRDLYQAITKQLYPQLKGMIAHKRLVMGIDKPEPVAGVEGAGE